MKYLVGVLLLLVGCTSTVVQDTQDTKRVTLLYQSNRLGSFEPCGCHSTPYGGLDREQNFVAAEAQKNPVLYVDGGDSLAPEEFNQSTTYYQERAKKILAMLEIVKVDMLAPGAVDLKLGVDFVKALAKDSTIPFVASNLVDAQGQSVFSKYKLFNKNGVRFAVAAVLPEGSYEGYKAAPWKETLTTLVPEMKQHADVLLLVSHFPADKTDEIAAAASDFAAIIGSDTKISLSSPNWVNAGKTLILETANYGYRIGKLDWDIRLPYIGSNSPTDIQANQDLLASLQLKVNENPKDEMTAREVSNIQTYSQLALTPGYSQYNHAIVGLTEEDYGQSNEVAAMMKDAKEALKQYLIAKSSTKVSKRKK